ncbi:hypothetical protein [Thalassotalea marina]|uniref:Uncharacterized protein n=1 Tax=Thalassotalea marina TaxID=1673741 RepID=A0A919BE06_9GAMM|nr:hypothetical protein [Thalassotalea marina]GHF84276.1 hypothetical protein GCM10017161_09590 [Thalassotalea marina]
MQTLLIKTNLIKAIFIAMCLLITLLFILVSVNENVPKGTSIKVTGDSLYKIVLPTNTHYTEQIVANGELLNKGQIIAKFKDSSGRHVGVTQARDQGYFVKNPDCCHGDDQELFGYLVKKSKNEVIFFQSNYAITHDFSPGEKVVIQSSNLSLEGEVLLVMGAEGKSIKMVYGISFNERPNFQSLLYGERLVIRKISPVKGMIEKSLKEVFMIRL